MSFSLKGMVGVALAVVFTLGSAQAFILEEELEEFLSVRSTDSLAQRDEYGLLHQGKASNPTDWESRNHCRFVYYFKSSEQLTAEPAYVGALQRDLHRLGYYCGPIDGVFTPQVSEAIARLQKNNSMGVTGTLTIPVRRALHLP